MQSWTYITCTEYSKVVTLNFRHARTPHRPNIDNYILTLSNWVLTPVSYTVLSQGDRGGDGKTEKERGEKEKDRGEGEVKTEREKGEKK